MTSPQRKHKPALNYHWLTGLYDSVVGRAMPERKFKSALIAQANVSRGQRVLDFGCGTATLTLMIEAQAPEAEVVGVDVDERALAIATRKAGAVQSKVRFERISRERCRSRMIRLRGCFPAWSSTTFAARRSV